MSVIFLNHINSLTSPNPTQLLLPPARASSSPLTHSSVPRRVLPACLCSAMTLATSAVLLPLAAALPVSSPLAAQVVTKSMVWPHVRSYERCARCGMGSPAKISQIELSWIWQEYSPRWDDPIPARLSNQTHRCRYEPSRMISSHSTWFHQPNAT